MSSRIPNINVLQAQIDKLVEKKNKAVATIDKRIEKVKITIDRNQKILADLEEQKKLMEQTGNLGGNIVNEDKKE